LNFGHFSNNCKFHFPPCHATSFPTHTSPNPTHSLSFPWPANGKRGDTSCFLFYTRPPPFYTNSISFTIIPNYKFLFNCKSPLFLPPSLQQERLLQNPHFLHQTLAPRNPKLFTSISRLQELIKGFNKDFTFNLQLPRQHQDLLLQLKLQQLGGLKPSSPPLDQAPN